MKTKGRTRKIFAAAIAAAAIAVPTAAAADQNEHPFSFETPSYYETVTEAGHAFSMTPDYVGMSDAELIVAAQTNDGGVTHALQNLPVAYTGQDQVIEHPLSSLPNAYVGVSTESHPFQALPAAYTNDGGELQHPFQALPAAYANTGQDRVIEHPLQALPDAYTVEPAPVAIAIPDGFDFIDAVIGGAVVLGAVLLALAAAILIRSRRRLAH